MFQAKNQDKSPETDPKEMEVYDLHVTVFKIIIINMFIKVRGTMNEQSENLN